MKLEYRKNYCGEFLCGYYRIHDLVDINDILYEAQVLSQGSHGYKFIMTLDDIGQASYTSMHSKMSNELDGGEWLTSENIDPSWMDGDFLRDDLGFDKKFLIRKLGFKHGLSNVKLEDIFKKSLFLDQESRDDVIEVNKNPLTVIDKEVYLLKVPVEYSYEAILSFPNGYFSCDLSPFENYRLAEHLEKEYGFHLFGIGASYISFIKGPRFEPKKVDMILEFLAKIYLKNEDREFIDFMRLSILNRDILTLRYSE
ncbi:hypothetical protein [Marinobacter sp. CA1]|uniref:hypothetical protein n=1 Tax=Marinobacter sp. CA1 TaxID=2817656 RepID=UPI001D08C44E|nr:hypothetical protein [Marinobacter sp. CA1]UDL06506.1 hypothetical protein J2887_07045 [Marinobacter sp. CA1]